MYLRELGCATRPANHQLQLHVDCVDQIPEAAYPRVILEDGATVPSVWQRRTRPWWTADQLTAWLYSPPETKVVVRTGTELPVDHTVRVVSRVPAPCSVVEAKTCSTRSRLCDHGQPTDCCALFQASGTPFLVESSPDAGTANQVDDGSSTPEEFELFRFRTGIPDLEPPPAVSLSLPCSRLAGDRPQVWYQVDVQVVSNADLSDVVEIEIIGRREDTGAEVYAGGWLAPACASSGPRTFAYLESYTTPLGLAQTSNPNGGVWSFRARTWDAAGNQTGGPETVLRFPDDCLSVSENLVGPPNFASTCTLAAPVAEADASWCQEVLAGATGSYAAAVGSAAAPTAPPECPESAVYLPGVTPTVEGPSDGGESSPSELTGTDGSTSLARVAARGGGCGCVLGRHGAQRPFLLLALAACVMARLLMRRARTLPPRRTATISSRHASLPSPLPGGAQARGRPKWPRFRRE